MLVELVVELRALQSSSFSAQLVVGLAVGAVVSATILELLAYDRWAYWASAVAAPEERQLSLPSFGGVSAPLQLHGSTRRKLGRCSPPAPAVVRKSRQQEDRGAASAREERHKRRL